MLPVPDLTKTARPSLSGVVRRRPGRAALPPGFSSLWVTVAVDLVGFGIVLPVLPLYARRLSATPFQATMLVAAFSAASLVCSPLLGRLSDRVGRRPVLLLSLAGTAAGSLLTGLAGSLPLLIAGRLIDGASGASVSVAQAAAADMAAPGQRPRLIGLLGAAFGVGFVAGPALGALASLGGQRLPFFVAAGIAGTNAVVALRRLPETRPRSAGSSPRDRSRARGRGALQIPGAPGLVTVSFCAVTAFSAFEATLAVFGARHLGLGIGSSAAVFAAVGLVLVVVQGAGVHVLVGRVGERPALGAGLVADAAGLVLLSRTGGWQVAVPALALLTIGQALVQTTMASVLAGLAGPDRRGELLGLQQAASGLGRVAGPAMGGALLGAAASGRPYLAGAGLLGVALAVLAIVGRPPRPVDDGVAQSSTEPAASAAVQGDEPDVTLR